MLPAPNAPRFGPQRVTPGAAMVTVGAGGQWDDGDVSGPVVWWDGSDWKMVYAAYNAANFFPPNADAFGSVGLASASALGGTWTKSGSNPIFSPLGSGDELSVTAPYIFKESGTYHLFYAAGDELGFEQGTKTLKRATSTDLTAWTRQGSVIETGDAEWCAAAVWHPNVVKVGSTYHLFVNGTDDDGFEPIGHASAASLAGPWTVTPGRVLDVGEPGSFDESHVADPWVYRQGDYWLMAYAGVDLDLDHHDSFAWTTVDDFPLGWRKHGQPTLSDLTATSFNGGAAYTGGRPCIVNDPSGQFHFYSRGWPTEIAVAR